MKKHPKKILTAALAVVLAFLIPATSVSAAATDWQLTYTQTVLENAIYYYNNAGYDLTFGTFVGASGTAYDRYYVWYDFTGLTSDQMETYLQYGSKFGSVTTTEGNICDLMYQWWLPLGSGIAEDGYFTFYIGFLVGKNYVTQGGTSFSFGDCINYNAGTPAFTFQALNTNGYVDVLDDITFTIESYTKPIGTTMKPSSWPSTTGNIYQIKVVVDCTNLSDYASLGIRYWTWDNTTGTVATYINPYVYFMIDPSDMWITEAGETTPETEAPGETVAPNPDNQEILNEIVAVGSQLKEINDTLIVPDSAEQSEFEQKESEKAEIESQLNDHLESMGIVTLPPQDDINVDIDGIIQNNPYEESWLDAVFGGLWSNKYILQTLLLSFVFAYFGFVLYGKKA